MFGIKEFVTAKDVWVEILHRLLKPGQTSLAKWEPELEVILKEGTLSDRILRSVGGDTSMENITKVYKKLSWCLAQNKMFVP